MDEIEVKGYFFLKEENLVHHIEELLSEKLRSKWVEHSIEDVFLDYDGTLTKRGIDLRCRKQDEEVFLTLKGPTDLSSGYKIREEVEIKCNDFNKLLTLFSHLGYRRRRHLSKTRKVLKTNNVMITIDIYKKLGFVLEIEGKKEQINKILDMLPQSLRNRFGAYTLKTVLKMYRQSKKQNKHSK